MKNFKNNWQKLILMYNLINIISVLIFYNIIPNILNYPPNSINNEFQLFINGLTYTQQYMSILLLCIIIENTILIITYRAVKKLLYDMDNLSENKLENLYLKAEKIVTMTSKIIYIIQVFVPILVIITTFWLLKGNLIVIIKVSLMFFVMLLSIATISYTFSRKIFKDITMYLFYKVNKNKEIKKEVLNEIKRTSIKTLVIVVVIPILIVTIVFITFIGYSQILKSNGNLLYKLYDEQLNMLINSRFNNEKELKNKLSEIEYYNLNDEYFIIYPNGQVETQKSNELSVFFIKYMNEISDTQEEKNRTYDFYATDYQGIFYKVNINDNIYTIGIKYTIASIDMLVKIANASIIIAFMGIILLLYSLKYIFSDIKLVTEKLNKISKVKTIDLNDRIPIISNDEVSDLVKAFTNVQSKTNKYLEQIEKDRYAMQRQAQFSILGEFAGGLAHDLNSPLSSLKLDIGTLKKYINSDKIIVQDDFKEKLNEMLSNIDSSLNNMGNTITGVRNQIRATGDTEKEEFLLIDIIEGIKIVFRSAFMKSNCQLEVNIPNNLKIYGEKNKLDRVIGNIIKNSLDAYIDNNIKGVITVGAEQESEKIIIHVKDNAGGIDSSIQDKVFKEIKTTKKENGTGFGLYYSNTVIESSYKGKMYFQTEPGVGTTVYIELPKNKKGEI